MVLLFSYLPGNFVKIVLVSKNAPRGSHCGGAENVAIATHRRRRMSQATFFIYLFSIQLFSGKFILYFKCMEILLQYCI